MSKSKSYPELSFGFSPCPNDTFAFHALVHDLLPVKLKVKPFMADIEELNRRAHNVEFDLTKLSFGALAKLTDRYVPLSSGAALGYGVGPLIVSREDNVQLKDISSLRIAVPGLDTTAFLLLRLALDGDLAAEQVVELRYDEILGAVERGDVDAGLIIHESRFTYEDHGLKLVTDLGDWWYHRTAMPVPLATICARRDLDEDVRALAEQAISKSVKYAYKHPDASADWVAEHAQEMSAKVCRKHIELYVNDYTIDLGVEGESAVDALLAAAPAFS